MRPVFDLGGEVGALMAQLDWSRTPLGPPEAWPKSLRTVVRIMLTSRYPMWLGWGPSLTLLYNDPYARILGKKHPAALGNSTREVWQEIWGEVGPRLEHVLSTGEATYDEALLLIMERHGYSEETYFTFSYSPLFDDDGRIAGNFCVVMEDTERVIGERRVALLRDIAAGLAEATTVRDVLDVVKSSLAREPKDLPFSLLYLVDGAGAHGRLGCATGFDRDAELDPKIDLTDAAEVWGPRQVGSRKALVLPLPRQGQAAPADAFVAGLNPLRPLDDAYRTFLHLFAGQVASGLTNARAYEEERRRADALAALDRAKTAFFSNISHEFRTPLTLMLGPTEDALASGGAMARDQIELIHRNELRLLKLVNALLDFSRIEAGRAKAAYEPTDLAGLTADLASTFRSAIERGGLTFDVDCPRLDQPVYVDRTMWEKIVLNLLSNAFKFTLGGGIRLALKSEGEAAVLTVADSGVGIAVEELPRLFERFHRVEGTAARTHEGSGIGLALVQDLVRLHGGSIAVSSDVGRGTTFHVRVPFGAAHLPQDQIGPPANRPAGGGSSHMFVSEAERWLDVPAAGAVDDAGPHITAVDGHGRARIVLADDNADMRGYLARLLGGAWSVEPVANGRQALRAVLRERPDLVVTDVMMPELDGFGLVRLLRADEDTRDIPIIMLSAKAGEDARLEGMQAGADDYVVKPFSARELMARIETQLLRASMRAVESRQRRQLAEIFRQAPAAIAILRGPTHVFEHANPAYLALIGNREIIGLPIRAALPELRGQGIYELLDDVYATGKPHVGKALRMMVARDAGVPEESFFDFVYEAMRDATGRIDGIAVVAFDVTDLARARRDAELANRTKDDFLAMLGHELRNPLAPMRTALQLMRLRGGETLERERTVIERQTQHLVRLVDDLLDVSRIARGKIDLRREHVDLAEAVAKAIEMASPLLEERQHDLSVDVPRGLNLDADPARLAQIIANLLTNAAKYTESGGRVWIGAERQTGWIVIRVRDSGIGIAPDMLSHVFEMFAQERQGLDRTQGGLGLGLTIVRNLVTLHGGSVEARSEGRGKGSEFIVRLPVTAAAPAAAPTAAAPAAERPRPSDRARVLVVDDNVDAADMFADYLESLGYEVQKAHDGPAAIRVAVEFSPAVALLDIGLPVMDGYELAGRLRDIVPYRLKLIAVTGYGQEADRDRAKEAGFDAHLVKPVDLDTLADLLAELVTMPA